MTWKYFFKHTLTYSPQSYFNIYLVINIDLYLLVIIYMEYEIKVIAILLKM